MKCIGVYKNTSGYRLYYDLKHEDYLLLTPNFHFTRCFGHCHDQEVAEWANNLRDKHRDMIKKGVVKYREC